MILVHAGNRTDAADRGGATRFPESHVPDVEHRVGRLLQSLRPSCVVGAAAAGADLIVIREACRRKIPVRIVLPLPEDQFVQRSIADRGTTWLEIYRSLRSQIADEHVLVSDLSDADDWYIKGNDLILDAAAAVAGTEQVVTLVIRPATTEDSPSATDDFVERAKDRGYPLIGIDPTANLADLKDAFVIMPYGTKRDPRSGKWVDFESVFNRLIVPSLENAALNWQRADRSFESGLIHDGMIEQIANAHVVIADLSTDNPNVYYELGLRHALARRMTVLLARKGTQAPFDIRDIRIFRYDASVPEITDEEAFAAYAAMQQVLVPPAVANADSDSPLYRLFTVDPLPKITRTGESPRQAELQRLEIAVANAEQLGQIDGLVGVAKTLADTKLPHDDVAVLRLRVGIAMRLAGDHEMAAALLESLSFAADSPVYVLWHREAAMALRRVGETLARQGSDAGAWWDKAVQHLRAALAVSPDDAESLGIQGGLLKQQFNRAIADGDAGQARLLAKLATSSYEHAIDDDPTNFYALFNAAALYRLRGQHLGGDADDLARCEKLLPVARFHAERHALHDFWAAVTVADIDLTQHLLNGTPALGKVEDLYVDALTKHWRPDMLIAVLNQLRVYRQAGDPTTVIDRIESVVSQGSAHA